MNRIRPTLRFARDEDAVALCALHRASIQCYCAAYYPEEVILDWIRPFSPADYRQLPSQNTVIIAEHEHHMLGFGVYDGDKHAIEKLYIAPNAAGLGIGTKILNELEAIAQTEGAQSIVLSSTLNAVAFYEHRGYVKASLSSACRARDNLLGCISMVKHMGHLPL
jgi:GNAT superfamily N-acetyltransferase